MVHATPVRRREKVRVAAIGFGGRGKADLNGMKGHEDFQLTAGCDVDSSFFKMLDEFGENVKTFQDYRKLFKDASDDFDAVLIATPDHMHAPIALMAMEHDKHVYLQKPLAQDIKECRLLAEAAAKKPQLATQMGIQIHAHAFYRTAVQWIQSGLIGSVTDVHSWSGKGWGGEQPEKAKTPVPETLDWDLYVGVSPFRDYVDGYYHRNNWRKWFAFGTGTQGDMGCHIVDPVFTALELREPTKITSLGPEPFAENFALESHVVYEFKGTQYTSRTINMTWYNGSLRPKELQGIPKEIQLPHQGSVFVGEKGSLILPHIGEPQVYTPEGVRVEKLPEKVASTNHFHDWLDAAAGKKEKASAPFEYAGPLTEAVLLGTIINRWPEETFAWNAEQCQFEGGDNKITDANALLGPKYRTGW